MSVSVNDRAAKDLLDNIYFTLEGYTWGQAIGSEFILWKQISIEDSVLGPESIMRLRSLSDAAGGWWHFPEGLQGHGKFVTLQEWNDLQPVDRSEPMDS